MKNSDHVNIISLDDHVENLFSFQNKTLEPLTIAGKI